MIALQNNWKMIPIKYDTKKPEINRHCTFNIKCKTWSEQQNHHRTCFRMLEGQKPQRRRADNLKPTVSAAVAYPNHFPLLKCGHFGQCHWRIAQLAQALSRIDSVFVWQPAMPSPRLYWQTTNRPPRTLIIHPFRRTNFSSPIGDQTVV